MFYPLEKTRQEIRDMSFVQLMMAGTLAGTFQMFATYPVETVKKKNEKIESFVFYLVFYFSRFVHA
jgi:hypothetical protein